MLTTLPKNDYILGTESKFKADISKYTLENTFKEINFEEVYEKLKKKYENFDSPISWFKIYSDTNLFVIL